MLVPDYFYVALAVDYICKVEKNHTCNFKSYSKVEDKIEISLNKLRIQFSSTNISEYLYAIIKRAHTYT